MTLSLEQEKAQQACEILSELGLDCWLVWVRETSQMADPVLPLILGGDLVWESALLFTSSGEKIAIVGNFDADGLKAKEIFDDIIPYTQSIRDALVSTLKRIAPESIAINYSKHDVSADGLTLGMHKLLLEYLGDSSFSQRLVSAEPLIQRLRGRKTPTEQKRIREAVRITEEIFEAIQDRLRPGMTELDIYRQMHKLKEPYDVGNAWNADHNPAVDAGPNKQFGHAGPTLNRTKKGHLLHFDFGVKKDGYCSDLQRMFYFGRQDSVPEEIQSAFDAVHGAITAAADFIRPDRIGHEVDQIARDYVKEHGYEEYQHALGHQVGRQAHDGGTLLGPLWDRYGDSPKGALEVGNVFTLELYVTTQNYGQVSLEEDILVTETGCEFLSRRQNQLICIG